MKVLYEVKYPQVSSDWGRFEKYIHVMWTTNREKAEAKAAALREEIKARDYWWMSIGKNKNKEPDVIVELAGWLED